MAVYYNEYDRFAAAWLRALIKAGQIADGEVDERSITDVHHSDLRGFAQCHFFAGIGGWSYALRLAGWPDDRRVWTGSCPCQPFSVAGKGKAEDDERHLWPAFRELIAQCQPAVVFGEQTTSPAGRRWLAGVRADMEDMDYRLGAADLCAAGISAPHIRQRLYWVGESISEGLEGHTGNVANWGEPGRLGAQAGRPVTAAGCGVHGMAYAECDATKSWRAAVESAEGYGAQGSGASVESGRRGCDSGLPDSNSGGCASIRIAEQARQQGASGRQPDGRGSYWEQHWEIGADGLWRRIKPGLKPLDNGLSGKMARLRTGSLRGYGNAIVPQLAAEFIQAYLETKGVAT